MLYDAYVLFDGCFVIVEMLVEKDRLITKAIEEKQNLVAQILNVPLQDFQHVAEV